jgi:hypothetical protein
MTYKGMVKATKSVLQLRQWWGFNMSKSSSFMLKEISNEIRAIRESKGEYWIYWNEERKKALKNILKWFASGILGTHASQTVILDQAFWSEKSPFRMIYKAAGISDNMLKMRNYTFDAVDGWEVDGIFDEYVEESLKPLGTVADKVADSVRDAVNDSIFEKAA